MIRSTIAGGKLKKKIFRGVIIKKKFQSLNMVLVAIQGLGNTVLVGVKACLD